MKHYLKFVSLILLLSLAIGSAYAQSSDSETGPQSDKERARAYFRMGVELYRERNYQAALIEFKRAYKTYPHYKLLYNLGQTSSELQDYVAAIDYLNAYLRAGGDDIEPERVEEAKSEIQTFETRLASLTVTSNVDGAEVFVDNLPVGTTPLEKPLRLSAGRRTISAEKRGFARVETAIDIGAGDHQSILLKIEPTQDLSGHSKGASGPSTNWPAIGTGIAASVLAVAGITSAIFTAFAEKAYEEERRSQTTESILDELRDDTKTKALLTDLFIGGSLLSAAATVTFFFLFDEWTANAEHDAKTTVGIGSDGKAVVSGRF